MNKITRIISLVFVLFLAFLMVGCKTKANKREIKEVEVLDDKYRNYYEIFVHSFYDSNNDGIGDLNGVIEKLDYVKDMGYNGIWLMPISSGYSYHKYDVLDYYTVDSSFGTNDDLKNLIDKCHEKGIDIILDLVVNHTSDKHPWFTEATRIIKQTGRPGGKYGSYYNFQTSYSSGYSQLNGTSYYYEAQFWGGMPDLNLNNSDVKNEISNVMKFYLEMGVDGFRLDACTSYYTGYTQNTVQFLTWLYSEAKKYKSDVYMVGEAWLNLDSQIRQYYESGVDSFFTFTLAQGKGSISQALREYRQDNGKYFGDLLKSLDKTYNKGIMAPFLSNHDTQRAQSFLGTGVENKTKMAQGLISLMSGTTFTYYGEEIGMSSPVTTSDPSKRVALLWDTMESEGYCNKQPDNMYVTMDSYYTNGSIKEQQENKNSLLNYYKYCNYLRNCNPEIARGTLNVFDSYYEQSEYVTVFTKTYDGKTITIVVNLNCETTIDINLNKDELGFEGLSQYLCANYDDDVVLKGTTITLPPYSIAILR